MIDFKTDFSRGVLLRLVVALLLLGVGLAYAMPFILRFYFTDQLTTTGYIINGAIVALFLLGMGDVVVNLVRYMREERALGRFIKALDGDLYSTLENVDPRSLIQRRLHTVQTLAKQNAPINHNALAATLVAKESTRIGLLKFINSVLILTGVFGTIVSLSIALLGAANLLEAGQELANMQLVIHGMSTALNTTLTAIVCYFVFGYFYLKVLDAKTHLLSGVEQVTALYLMPKYSHTADHLLHDVAGLARNLRQVSEAMQAAQRELLDTTRALREVVAGAERQFGPVAEDISAIRRLLRDGFRLPEEG